MQPDPSSGRTYYVNTQTQETSWEDPALSKDVGQKAELRATFRDNGQTGFHWEQMQNPNTLRAGVFAKFIKGGSPADNVAGACVGMKLLRVQLCNGKERIVEGHTLESVEPLINSGYQNCQFLLVAAQFEIQDV